MSESKLIETYKLVDGNLIGPGLRIDAGALVEPERQNDIEEGKKIILDAILDLLNGAYLQGRATVRINVDERESLAQLIRDVEMQGCSNLNCNSCQHHTHAIEVLTRLTSEPT